MVLVFASGPPSHRGRNSEVDHRRKLLSLTGTREVADRVKADTSVPYAILDVDRNRRNLMVGMRCEGGYRWMRNDMIRSPLRAPRERMMRRPRRQVARRKLFSKLGDVDGRRDGLQHPSIGRMPHLDAVRRL